MIRDRVKELRRVRAGDVLPHEDNWRTHPPGQKEALSSLLREVGYADALLAYETPAGLKLIDGHLRQELTPDSVVPVLVLDVSEAEARKLLATLDPLAAMAQADASKLESLLEEVDVDSDVLASMLQSLAGTALEEMAVPRPPPAEPANDPRAEWKGMPEFQHEDRRPCRTLLVHFRSGEDVQDFCRLIGQQVTPQTKSLWHPERAPDSLEGFRYASQSEVSGLHHLQGPVGEKADGS